MTSRSMNWSQKNKGPILLHPAGKNYLWGGTRLKTEYGKNIPLQPLAETWECSTHPDGLSVVASGAYKGRTLKDVLAEHPEWLGTHPKDTGELPVLIKFIDAAHDLSIQVHPNDAYALQHEGQAGKTEMWYVLDAEPDASLIYGFLHDMDEEKLHRCLNEGTLLNHLQKVKVHKDDVFFIEPGTIHAIGGGVLLAEIQESSNVTYRVFDYERVDKNGQKRTLHIKQAVDVLNMKKAPQVRQQMRVMQYRPGSASETICRCEYFQVSHVLLSEKFECLVESTSFQVLLVLDGKIKIEELTVKKGDCVFLPADSGTITITGKGQLLQVCC